MDFDLFFHWLGYVDMIFFGGLFFRTFHWISDSEIVGNIYAFILDILCMHYIDRCRVIFE